MTGGRRVAPRKRLVPYVPEPMVLRLHAYCLREGLSLSRVVVLALAQYLDRQERGRA